VLVAAFEGAIANAGALPARKRVIGGHGGEQTKRFFFEKKNQKTCARMPPASTRKPSKSFCFFFQKEALPLPKQTAPKNSP
jgi:hypothetical protein